jgi:hypothetical protein
MIRFSAFISPVAFLAILAWTPSVLAQGQVSGGTSTGTSTGTGTGTGVTGTGSMGGIGGFGSGTGSTGGAGLGTGTSLLQSTGFTQNQLVTSGTGQGELGHVARAGDYTATGNPLGMFYVNATALGKPGTTTTSTNGTTFGTPLYGTFYGTGTGTGTTGVGGTTGFGGATGTGFGGTTGTGFGGTGTTGRGIGSTGFGGTTAVGGTTGTGFGGTGLGTTGIGGVGSTLPGQARIGSTTGLGSTQGGFTPTMPTTGYRPAPAYTTSVAFKYRATTPTQLQTNLKGVISRSTELAGKNIQVEMDGQTVVLRGMVADSDQRRLAENMLRLQPGVRAVRNELTVAE